MAPPFLAFDTRDALMQAASARIADTLERALARFGAACAALSGGTTPEPAYALLAQRPLDWSSVTFTLVDERFAPPGDPASNEGMVRRALAPAFKRGANLVPLWSDTTPEAAAAQASKAYDRLWFNVAVMGMGADGHTASWFPDAPLLRHALDPNNAQSVITISAASAAGKTERLTMTLSALKRAHRVLLLITGEEKRIAYEKALTSIAPSPIGALVAACGGRLETLWAP